MATLAAPQVPKTMADALDMEDAHAALLALSEASSQKAQTLAKELANELQAFSIDLPDKFRKDTDEIATTMASAESILNSLTKIATGGTQASQEIRTLEQEKRDLELHAQDVETALALRMNSDGAADALSSQKYAVAAQCVHDYLLNQKQDRHTKRALAYAGEYTVSQMETTQRVLKETLLQKYEFGVQEGNLQTLSELTPLLSQIQLEKEAVSMYLQFLQVSLSTELESQIKKPLVDSHPAGMPMSRAAKRRLEAAQNANTAPPYVQMARVYNGAVTALRHHLPMVSHFLHKADGDAAVVQLVHIQVEQAIVPLFQYYVSDRQLNVVARTSQRIYQLLEEKYVGRLDAMTQEGPLTQDMDDCGFEVEIGSLADVDGAMEEAALCLQHAESYQRFLQHTVNEVNKAREMRYKVEQDERRLNRERAEWATGMSTAPKAAEEAPYKKLDILPSPTQLSEVVAEVGGYYSGIERCLLLASMQRAFSSQPHYTDLGAKGHKPGVGVQAKKTSLVETCLFSARRSGQRAFATGHSGTASAMANFCSDTIGGVLLEVMTRRAHESGIAKLKPGDGLLEGSLNLFATTSNLMRQGTSDDETSRQLKMQQGISRACAALNDLDVAAHHIAELEKVLASNIAEGFQPAQAEHLTMCVRAFQPIQESFTAASNDSIESLVTTLRPRVRSVVTDAVGSDSVTSTSFMTSSALSKDRHQVRMNYKLDDAAYKLLQLSEGYMARLCAALDEMIRPLRMNLSPRLGDMLVLGVVGTAAKRLEASLRRVRLYPTISVQKHDKSSPPHFCNS
jgi:conserved oligomeric Golgi complex subunit 4